MPSRPPDSSPTLTFVEEIRTQFRIIGAIMMREMMTRFGRENLGFFWLMGEPLILTVGVMIIWSFIRHDEHNVSVVAFALTGYALLTIWRHIVSSSVRCFRNNSGLLFHRNVHMVDTLVAKALLEAAGTGIAFFIAYTALYLLELIKPIDDVLILIGAWCLMAWFSFAVGLILACLSEIWEIVERFVQPVMYLMLPISGAFFMVDWLPLGLRHIAEYSPLIVPYEMFRGGLFGDEVINTYWNAWYLAGWCLLLTTIGLALVPRARACMRFE